MVSEAQVEEAKKTFEDAKAELPATGELNAAIASLKDVINILSDVWQTDGGAREISNITSIASELDSYSSIESELGNLKTATVSISKGYHKDYLGMD